MSGLAASRRLGLVGVLLMFVPSVTSFAQTARDGRLFVTVVDPSGAVIENAAVSIMGPGADAKATTRPPATTSDKGAATIEGLAPGVYSIQAEFPGFEVGLVRDVRIRAGDNRQVVTLPLKKLEDSVAVGPDRQDAGSTRANATFGVTLSNEQIAALSDDPDEAASQLADLAGTDAVIRVDSFEGQQLPPKAQIKSIHVTRDQFAAETEQPGSTFVDIITQPGVGPVRGGATFSFRDGSMSGRSPFTPTKGPEQFRGYSFNLGGALIPQKSNFSISVNGRNDYTSPNLNVALPGGGTRAEALNLRQPNNRVNVNALLDYALTNDQTLRIGYSQFTNTSGNQGIGAYDLSERAYSYDTHGFQFRIQEVGPIGRRTFIHTRFTVGSFNNSSRSALEAPTIVVQDAFTSGGAQQAGGTKNSNFLIASDVDHVRGINSWRTGFQVSGGWTRADSNQNYLGTYTFSSLEAFAADQPQLYTRQIGDPTVSYFNAQAAVYLQDDIRVRKGLTFSPGVRYSLQTHVSDRSSVAPRFGVTWAPFASGKTTLRGSAGLFAGWLPMFIYEQTLRLDGQRQRELDISNPLFPDPGTTGSIQAANKYVLGDFKLQRNLRYSAGIDQTFTSRVKVNVLYNYVHLLEQPRGRNLNAPDPVTGVRPDPSFENIIETVTDTEVRRHELYVNVTLGLAEPGRPSRARFDWRRVNLLGSYAIIHARNNSNGAFAVPASGSVDTEWGPGPADQPYRIELRAISTQVKNLAASFIWNASDGFPYTWTTGLDDNHDGLLNDRPAGVGLRSLRTAAQSTLSTRLAYTFARAAAPGPDAQGRYRFGLYANITNLTNRANYGGYSGVQTSPFFQQPTAVNNPRRVDVGINLNF